MSGVAPDYQARAMEYGFASKEKILEILLQQGATAVLLDVRTLEEISDTGKIQVEGVRWVTSSCTPDACPELEVRADEILPNKTDPIIIYCKSGRRASKAEKFLKSQGYTAVFNAGGFDDLHYLVEA